IGLMVSPLCYFAIAVLKSKFGYDDALDAFGCHGIGGIFGGIVIIIVIAATNIKGKIQIESSRNAQKYMIEKKAKIVHGKNKDNLSRRLIKIAM
ncbi:hypothetical protein LGW58_09555, partial [Streptococcus mutans]|nr:hypothetical protein [Streptococcus mutans]